ncbi:uncharacterized protein [Porites lutea]|uniref:uncharacterized protein n=1 Tax=Porites lutea TaxID=51062 RepID=UPI003CC5223C
MAKIFRRAANKVKNCRDGHGSLGLLIFDEKVVYETFQKVVIAKADASVAMLKWAKTEENLALQDVFSKVFEVSSMWTTLWKDFGEEYYKHRKSFKEVLQQEKALDEARKLAAMHATKMSRAQKQMDQSKRKSDGGRPRTLISDEMVEVISQAEQEQAELEVKTTKHEIFKARKLKDSLRKISDGIQEWASKTLLVAGAYRKLADLINDTPTQLTESKVFSGAGQSRSIVNDLARDLKIDPELSKQLATASKSGQPYLYAVSTPLPLKREIGKYDYAYDVSREKLCKWKCAPRPLPRPHQRVRENSGMDQNHIRPLSLNDLRPPPNSPAPPLPTNARQVIFRPAQKTQINSKQQPGKIWYARTNIESGSESDSEGYAEPITDPSFFQQMRMLWKVRSDGAINEVGTGHAGVESRTGKQSSSPKVHHQLERRGSEEDMINDNNTPPTYVDLIQ